MICSILHALIICITCIKHQQMQYNLNDVLLLYYSHQHISATHVAIFRVISLSKRIQLQLKCLTHSTVLKNI